MALGGLMRIAPMRSAHSGDGAGGLGTLALCLVSVAMVFAPSAVRAQTGAGGSDTRLRLDQDLQAQNARRDAKAAAAAEVSETRPDTIAIDGRVYTVRPTVNDTGKALYIAVTRKQWADVRRFLTAYRRLSGYDPMLELYARGGLARATGHLVQAEQAYRSLMALQGDFLPGQLELARVLFESRQDRAARAAFLQARTLIAVGDDKAAGMRRTIDSFLHALDQRGGWHGSFALGASRATNINQSSGSYTCLLSLESLCLVDRKLPDPITAAGINFEGTLSRRWSLSGHGGLLARALTYGDLYPGYGAYDQTAFSLQLGYDRRGASSGWTLSPTADMALLGGRLLYAAWGLRAEGFVQLTGHTAARLEVTGRHFDYPSALYADYSGNQGEAYLTLWQTLSPRWSLFGGPEMLVKGAAQPVNAFGQMGVRLGAAGAVGKLATVSAVAAHRWRDYRAYSDLLEGKRQDVEDTLTATLRLSRWKVAGLAPELFIQASRIRSSIDWLYSYRKTTMALRLTHVF